MRNTGSSAGPVGRERIVYLCSQALSSLAAKHLSWESNSVYMWGSVLTPDFDDTSSDIDVLLVTSEQVQGAVAALRAEAAEMSRLLCRLDAMVLPVVRAEFPPKPLDRLDPRVVISQRSSFRHVWGNDRLAKGITSASSMHEVLDLRLRSLELRLRLHRKDPDDEPLRAIVKEISFVCHFAHAAVVGPHLYSRENLRLNSRIDTAAAVDLVLSCHRDHWRNVERDHVLAVAERLISSMNLLTRERAPRDQLAQAGGAVG